MPSIQLSHRSKSPEFLPRTKKEKYHRLAKKKWQLSYQTLTLIALPTLFVLSWLNGTHVLPTKSYEETPSPMVISPETEEKAPANYEFGHNEEINTIQTFLEAEESYRNRHLKCGLAMAMQLLDKDLSWDLRDTILKTLPSYIRNLKGHTTVLREIKPNDADWRFSSPGFLTPDRTIIRVVNYYVDLDGSYHVSNDHQVKTKMLVAETDEWISVTESPAFSVIAAQENLRYPDVYVTGLEDTRFLVHDKNAPIYTLSSSSEYTRVSGHINQVLGILDPATWTMTIQDVIKSPNPEHHEKNWVFADGLQNIVYGWYPSIQIGAIDLAASELVIHTSIESPKSFSSMRGSTNGVLHENEWWFVTHAVLYRPGQLRYYSHRIVVLDEHLKSITRYSLPFTFEKDPDVEYCLGFKADDAGVTFGYSVRDRTSRTLHVDWSEVQLLFDDKEAKQQ